MWEDFLNKSREITRNFLYQPRHTAGNLSSEQSQAVPPLEAVPLLLFPLFPGELPGWKPKSQEQGGGMRSPSPHTPKPRGTHPSHCQAGDDALTPAGSRPRVCALP